MKLKTAITTLAAAAALLAVAAPADAARTLYLSDGGVANSGQATVYSLGDDGTPSQIQRFKTGKYLNGVSMTPDGKHVFFTDYKEHGVHAYFVAADGQLTAVPGSPFVLDPVAEPYGSAVSPDGRFLLVGDFMRNGVESLRIGADGSLSKVPGGFVNLGVDAFPYMVAVSTNSKFAFTTDYTSDQVFSVAISPDGALTKIAGYPATGEPYEVILTPDGKYVYAPDSANGGVSGYAIGADGTLTALSGSPFPVLPGAYGSIAITPDGKYMYGTGQPKDIAGAAIAADGSLSAIPATPAANMSNPALAISPSGKYLYNVVTALTDKLTTYSVGSSGALTAIGTPLATEPQAETDLQSAVVSPNQGPVADVKTKLKNGKFTFDASGSSDPDGKVASYVWNFGDGTTETTTDKKVTHTYKRPGIYQAVVSLTDNEGCSDQMVFTGQTAYCNGTSAAVEALTVDAGIAEPRIKAKGSQKQKGKLKIAVKAGAGEKVTVAATGSATFKGAGKVALKKAKGKAKANKTTTLKLGAKKAAQGKAVVGTKGKARIKVTLTDNAGNVVSKTVKVKLK